MRGNASGRRSAPTTRIWLVPSLPRRKGARTTLITAADLLNDRVQPGGQAAAAADRLLQRVLRQSGAARIRALPRDRGYRSFAHQDQEPQANGICEALPHDRGRIYQGVPFNRRAANRPGYVDPRVQ